MAAVAAMLWSLPIKNMFGDPFCPPLSAGFFGLVRTEPTAHHEVHCGADTDRRILAGHRHNKLINSRKSSYAIHRHHMPRCSVLSAAAAQAAAVRGRPLFSWPCVRRSACVLPSIRSLSFLDLVSRPVPPGPTRFERAGSAVSAQPQQSVQTPVSQPPLKQEGQPSRPEAVQKLRAIARADHGRQILPSSNRRQSQQSGSRRSFLRLRRICARSK